MKRESRRPESECKRRVSRPARKGKSARALTGDTACPESDSSSTGNRATTTLGLRQPLDDTDAYQQGLYCPIPTMAYGNLA